MVYDHFLQSCFKSNLRFSHHSFVLCTNFFNFFLSNLYPSWRTTYSLLCIYAVLLLPCPSTVDDSPCAVVTCPLFSSCVVTTSGAPKCACAESCPFFYQPVCGSNRKSFFNGCYLSKYACTRKVVITMAYNGKCGKVLCLHLSIN